MRKKLNRRLLKDLRAARGWSCDEAARRIGITRQALNYIERGMVQPRTTTLLAIARVYEVGMADFYQEPIAS